METIKRFNTETIKKSRRKIKNGDVFVVKLKNHKLYFYGKVIDEKAKFNDLAEPTLIFLYKTPTTEIVIPEEMNENDIMTALLIDQYGWKCGHFYTICNLPVKETEKNADYGFISPAHGEWISEEEIESYSQNHEIRHLDDGRILASAYVDAYNNILDHKPSILSQYTLALYRAVSWEISKYLHENSKVRQWYGLV